MTQMHSSILWFGVIIMVMMLDLTIKRYKRLQFDSMLSRYQVVTNWMGERLRTGKPSLYTTGKTKANSAFYPSVIDRVLVCLAVIEAGPIYLCKVGDSTVIPRCR